MAKRGPPCKIDEVLTSGRWQGKTRAEAALDQVRRGARNRHAWMAAEIDESTFYGWLRNDAAFSSAYARAEAEGVATRLDTAAEGGEPGKAALELLRICNRYHHTVPDSAAPNEAPQDGTSLLGLLAKVAREAPWLLTEALSANREPELGAVENK